MSLPRVQQDTSVPANVQSLGCLRTKHHGYTCEMLLASFLSRAVAGWIQFRMSRERCRLEDGHNLFPSQCRLSAGKHFPKKVVYQKSKHLDEVILLAFGISVPSENMFLRDRIPKSCICGYRFAPIVETRVPELVVSLLPGLDFSPWIPLGTFSILLENERSHIILASLFFSFSWGLVV